MLRNKKVAMITGATGQDAALLARFLLDKGYYVIGIDRRTSSKTDWRLKELNLYSEQNFKVASGDVTDAGCIARLVQEFKPDEFYNLAAMSFVKESWNTPAATLQINTIGVINCLEAIRQWHPMCKFYQASSSEMFGGENRKEILDEKSTFYPRSPYGVSKAAAHWATINYRESFQMFTCCGILFNHESEYRGLEFVTRKITDAVVRIRLRLQDCIELGNLDSMRDWGFAGDFVHGMYLMLQQDEPDDYVLATGKAHSVGCFVKKSFEVVGIDPDEMPRYVKQNADFMRPAEVGYLLGNASKAKQKLGWEPKVSFAEMVERMVKKDIERVENEVSSRSRSYV